MDAGLETSFVHATDTTLSLVTDYTAVSIASGYKPMGCCFFQTWENGLAYRVGWKAEGAISNEAIRHSSRT